MMNTATETLCKRNSPTKRSRIELAREFTELPIDALATSSQLAAFLNCSEAKLERDRWAGGGIIFIKHGRQVRYMKRVVLAHLESSSRISTTHNKESLNETRHRCLAGGV